MTDYDLIKQVAEQVMGWRALKPFWADSHNNQKAMIKDWSPIVYPINWMQVVEKLALTHTVRITFFGEVVEVMLDGGLYVVSDKRVGRAICLASLKLMGR